MTESLTPTAAEAERSIVLERVFDAPRALVFQAWTNPAHLPRWFGPRGFSCKTRSIDVRVGGAWDFDMIGPDGTVYPNFMRFTSLRENEAIVYEHGVVSAECAEAMTWGILAATGATYGLATTGVAGPTEQEGKAVGTVFVGVGGPAGVRSVPLRLDGGRGEIQDAACEEALAELLSQLQRESGGLG